MCWGANHSGQLGLGTVDIVGVSQPRRVAGELSFGSVAMGEGFACGVTTDGTIYCWGDNNRGQVGAGGVGQRCAFWRRATCVGTPARLPAPRH